MPTGFGYTFAIVAFILIILAVGYGNNLLYFFVFLMVSMALTGMSATNKNIDGVSLENLSNTFIYSNEKNYLSGLFKNKKPKLNLYDIHIKIRLSEDNNQQSISYIKPLSTESLNIAWTPSQRGLQKLPRLHIQSRFPFRMLVAWKYFEKDYDVLVYPERKGSHKLPQMSGTFSQKETNAQIEKDGFFKDYRDYQKEDSPSRIAWKKSLKLQKHLVKNFESSGEKKIIIDWNMTENLVDPELRISQLALWVDDCHHSKASYSLRIDADHIPFDSGIQHYKLCMQKLALLPQKATR